MITTLVHDNNGPYWLTRVFCTAKQRIILTEANTRHAAITAAIIQLIKNQGATA